MNRIRLGLIFTLVSLSFLLLFPGCERTVEEDVIQPIEMMVGQKSVAAALAAKSNVQTVRAALMRYPAVSPSNEYPGDMDIYDYAALRKLLVDENLPSDMIELMWDPAFGIKYQSDGYTFTFQVKAFSGEMITATPEGITKN